MKSLPPQSLPNLPHRLLAMGLAALVFGLGLMSASPVLHDWVHAEHHTGQNDSAGDHPSLPSSDANHRCAIVAYAGGLTLAIDTVAPLAIPPLSDPAPVFATESFRIASPTYLLPPGRGPPARLS